MLRPAPFADRPASLASLRMFWYITRVMGRQNKLFVRILSGSSDTNIPFSGLRQLLLQLGFEERVRGSHHIFTKDGIEEIMNLQSKGAKAKPYQVKQVRNIILKYKLGGQEDDQI